MPTVVDGFAGVTEVAAHAGIVFLRGGIDAVSWGGSPTTVPGTANLHGITMGPGHVCAMASDDRVVCVGEQGPLIALPDLIRQPQPVTVGGL